MGLGSWRRSDAATERVGISGHAVGPLAFGLIAGVLGSLQAVVDGRAVSAVVLALLACWCGWRLAYCGIVATADVVELRSLARTCRLQRPCRGRAYTTLFGSLAVQPDDRRRVVVRSIASFRLNPRQQRPEVAELLENCGIDVSAIR